MDNSDLDEFFDNLGTTPSHGKNKGKPESVPSFLKNIESLLDNDSLSSLSLVGDTRWSESDGTFWRAKKTHKIIPAGLYKCSRSDGIGPVLIRQPLETDDLLLLPEPNSNLILEEFKKFWSVDTKNSFDKFGFIYKRGFLFWGAPGGGKTSILNLMMKLIIEDHNGIIVIIDNPDIASACLSMIRKTEATRPLITISEDIDALIERYGENEFLALFDGAEQIRNVIHIASTNYPERMDKRFISRPSRFDTIVKIKMPGDDARRMFIDTKMKKHQLEWFTKDELERWVNLSRGFTLAHIKEMIIAVCCLNQDIEDVADRLTKMHTRKITSDERDDDDLTPKVGF